MERNKYSHVLLSTSKLFPSHEMFIFLTHPMIDWCQETNNIMNKEIPHLHSKWIIGFIIGQLQPKKEKDKRLTFVLNSD